MEFSILTRISQGTRFQFKEMTFRSTKQEDGNIPKFFT